MSLGTQAELTADNIIARSRVGEDIFAGHIQGMTKIFKDEEENANILKTKNGRGISQEQIDKNVEAKLTQHLEGTLKPFMIKTAKGESLNPQEAMSMQEMQNKAGAAMGAVSALSGQGGAWGIVTGIVSIFTNFSEYVSAFATAVKSDPNNPDSTFGQRFTHALQDAKSEKTLPEFAKAFNVNANGLRERIMKGPIELEPAPAAAPSTPQAALDAAGSNPLPNVQGGQTVPTGSSVTPAPQTAPVAMNGTPTPVVPSGSAPTGSTVQPAVVVAPVPSSAAGQQI